MADNTSWQGHSVRIEHNTTRISLVFYILVLIREFKICFCGSLRMQERLDFVFFIEVVIILKVFSLQTFLEHGTLLVLN